jgi:arginine kinase
LKEKRDEFRKYLEGTGVTDKLTGALMKLYQEIEKPEDPIVFIRKQLGDDCPPEKMSEMEEKIKKLEKEKKEMEMEKEVAQGQIKRSPSAEVLLLTSGFEKLLEDEEDEKSLLKEYLTEELFEKVKDLKTSYGGTLYDQIQSGLAHFDQEIGIFASDPHAYDIFDELFSPVLEDLHDVEPGSVHPDSKLGDPNDLDDLDPEKLFIKSITIKVGRAIKDNAFVPIIPIDKIVSIEKKIKEALLKVEDEEFKGTYHSLIDIEDEQLQKWIEDGTLFPAPEDKNLRAAETYRFWSKCRGVFISDKNNYRVWVNEQEHLQIVVFEDGGNLKAAYERLLKVLEFFNHLEFSKHARWGFLTHNLKNIGTSMKISVKAKFPKLSLEENASKMENLCDSNSIIADKLDDRGSYELFNCKKLGMTESDLTKDFNKGIKDFIASEKCAYLS